MRSRSVLIWLGLIVLAMLAFKGLVVVQDYIGYANLDNAHGGTITRLVLEHRMPQDFWAGMYGVSVRVAGYTNQQYDDFTARDMKENNLLFDCMERNLEHEVYAIPGGSTPPSVPDQLYPVTAAEVGAYFNKNASDFDSVENTYTQPISFDYGTVTVTTPGTITYKVNEAVPATFRMAIAKTAGGTPVFVAILTNFTSGFNNRIYNYQLLLPAPSNQTTRYWFFTDPHDICPEGEGVMPNMGVVYGKVTTTTGMLVEGALIDVAGRTNLTNSSGDYRITTPEGIHNIFAIKTGYKVYQNNVTVVAGAETRHDIILEEEIVPNPNTNIGPGQDQPGDNWDVGPSELTGVGPGEDVGPGEAPITPVLQAPKVIEGRDYLISLIDLNRKLRQGQFLQDRIVIYSFKKGPVHVSFAVNGTNISKIVNPDKWTMDVEPGGVGEFVLTIFGIGDVGTYTGTIELAGDLNASIPVNIEILPKEQLPVEALHVEVETAEKTYYPGDMVRVKTDLRNLLSDQEYPVHLFFTVQSPDGNRTLWTYDTNVYIRTAFSLIKAFELPADTLPDDYLVRVSASYLGLSAGTSTIFHVAVPFWQRTLFGLKNWIWMLILLGAGLLALGIWLIYRNIQSKKKYHLKVDYDELPKPGPRSIWVGKIAETDKTTYFNLENFKTHTIVAGSTGGGKSVSAQVIIEEALDKGVAVLVFDPTAQWSGMLRPCKDKTMLSLYPLFGMKRTDAKGFNGNIRQINDAREKIDIKKYVRPGEIQVFACHKLDPKDMDILVANAIREIFHQGFGEEKLLKVMFVFDEVHRLLPKFGGSGDGFLQIERSCREFRKWGLGVMLISQVLSDFVGTIKANINTEIQMRTRDEGDLERIRVKYGEEVLRSLVKATVGSGMVENPAYNRGKPYFVAFKPLKHSVERLSDEEIEQYNSSNDEIDNLQYSLEQLEKEGVDVFDLKLELKLALDKVKTGNFNMVKIYLEGLVPRIDKAWEKLGKQPKKLVRELVNMADIKAELAKAQQERETYLAEQQTAAAAAGAAAGGAGAGGPKEWGWKDDVPPGKILNLKNGMIVINLSSLYDEASAMKDADLPKEFDPEPKPEEGKPLKQPINRFATWALEATGDVKLANNLASAKTKEELLAVLVKRKNKEPLPDVKPPAWFASAEAGKTLERKENEPTVGAAKPGPAAGTNLTPSSVAAAQPETASANAPIIQQASPAEQPVRPRALPQASETTVPPAFKLDEIQAAEIPAQRVIESNPAPAAATTPLQAELDAKRHHSLERLVISDESKAFWLEDGTPIRSVKDLLDYLPKMDEGTFRHHVGLDYNHFADWISGVFHEHELARKVAHAQNKEQLRAALED